jgi:c-di-GMP-binding flagellar brake protein YcgR
MRTRLANRREAATPGETMKNERRDTPRIPIALETVLTPRDQNYRRVLTRNISLDGAFIETNNGTFDRKQQRVEIAIRLAGTEESRFHRFEAQVVRVTEKGAGVSFDKIDTDAYAALLDFVFSRQGRGLW